MGVLSRLFRTRRVRVARVPRVALISPRPGLKVTITKPPGLSGQEMQEIKDAVRSTRAFGSRLQSAPPRIELHMPSQGASTVQDVAAAIRACERRCGRGARR